MLGNAPEAGAADLFSTLRTTTADLHQRLEDRLDLTSPGLTPEHYADAVGIIAAATLAVEAGIQRVFQSEPALAEALDWGSRRKTDAVVTDLRALGRRLPCCVEPLALSDTAGVVGAMYVTEGSTLGGQAVESFIRRRLGDDTPRASFVPYGKQARRRWDEFQAAASELVTSDDIDRAAEAASATFALYLDVADQVLGRA